MATSGLGALAGAVGMLAAARLYPPSAVGAAGVALSGAPFVNVFAGLGLAAVVLRRLGRSERPGELLGAAYGVGCATTLLAAVAYSHFIPVAAEGAGAPTALVLRLAFVALAVGMFMQAVQDSALYALDLAASAAVRTAALQASRVLLIVALARVTAAGIVVSAAVSYLAVCGWLQWRLLRPLVGALGLRCRRWVSVLADDAHYLSGSYGLDILAWMPPALLPLIVSHQISAEASGQYYVAWLVYATSMLPVVAVVTAEVAGQSKDIDRPALRVRSLLLGPLAAMCSTVALLTLGSASLSLFGGSYEASGGTLLRMMCLACLPASVQQLYVARARLQLSMGRPLVLCAVRAGLLLSLSYALMPAHGLAGVGVAFVVTEWTSAILSALLWLSSAWLRPTPVSDSALAN